MSDNQSSGGELEPIRIHGGASGDLVIPVAREDFGEFLADLLKVPKTLKYSLTSSFLLRFTDIEDFVKLIEQRIADQQNYSKISEEYSAYYCDGFSVHCPTLEEFSSHSALSDEACERISISLVYLVEFPNETIPQRQEISLEFYASFGPPSMKREEFDVRYLESYSLFGQSLSEFSIRHTHVTFGHDLAALLKSRMRRLKVESKTAEIFKKNWVAFPWFTGFFIAGTGISIYLASAVSSFLFQDETSIIEALRTGVLSNSIVFTIGITLLVIIGAFLFGDIIKGVFSKAPRSFIILNDRDSQRYIEYRRSRKSGFWKAGVAGLVTILLGAIGSFLATGIWEGFF